MNTWKTRARVRGLLVITVLVIAGSALALTVRSGGLQPSRQADRSAATFPVGVVPGAPSTDQGKGSLLPSVPTTSPGDTSMCQPRDLYGVVAASAARTAQRTVTVDLFNISSAPCELVGLPRRISVYSPIPGDVFTPSLRAVTRAGAVTGLASPGQAETFDITTDFTGCGGNAIAEVPDKTVDVLIPGGTVHAVVDGTSGLRCATLVTPFAGPTTDGPTMPVGPFCKRGQLHVVSVLREHVASHLLAYDLALQPAKGSCVLRLGDVETTVLGPTGNGETQRPDSVHPGARASASHPAHVDVVFADSSGCGQRIVASLKIAIDGAPLAAAPPPGEQAFTICGQSVTFDVSPQIVGSPLT